MAQAVGGQVQEDRQRAADLYESGVINTADAHSQFGSGEGDDFIGGDPTDCPQPIVLIGEHGNSNAGSTGVERSDRTDSYRVDFAVMVIL